MNAATDITSTPGGDVIAHVTSQLQSRLATIDAEATRIRQALTVLSSVNGATLDATNAVTAQQEATSTNGTEAVAVEAARGRRARRAAMRAEESSTDVTETRRLVRSGEQPKLRDVVAGVLQERDRLSPSEIAAAALATGYQTSARNFRQVVHVLLNKDKQGQFRKMADGTYKLRKGGAE